MKSAAVICEFNPMHDGHRALLGEMRRRAGDDAAFLCLMSGDYVQRGEPAVYDKFERAKSALAGGADLVLELPFPWSASVAEHFARGAVSILNSFGQIEGVYFGSEGKSAEELSRIAGRLDSREFSERFTCARREIKNLSFPKLTDRVYAQLYGEEPGLSPNEILGVEYLRSAAKLGFDAPFTALPMLEGFSASAERERIREEAPPDAAFLENGEKAILAHLLLCGKSDRFSRAAHRAATLWELFSLVRTPSDTDARLRRDLLAVLFESAGRESETPRFTVLLGANERGKRFLAATRKTREIDVVTKQARAPRDLGAKKQYALYQKAQSVWQLFTNAGGRAADRVEKKPEIK